MEGLIRQRVEIDEMQCGFISGSGTTDAILAHLSQRLIGELTVYKGIRRSTFSNDISSEAKKPILFIFHI